jgi:hypothetical protein
VPGRRNKPELKPLPPKPHDKPPLKHRGLNKQPRPRPEDWLRRLPMLKKGDFKADWITLTYSLKKKNKLYMLKLDNKRLNKPSLN